MMLKVGQTFISQIDGKEYIALSGEDCRECCFNGDTANCKSVQCSPILGVDDEDEDEEIVFAEHERKKEASSFGGRIFKYPLEICDRQTVSMPEGADILTVKTQRGKPYLWAMVNESKPTQGRTIRIYGTGHSVMEAGLSYIDTFLVENDDLVFHVFEEKENDYW